MRWRYSAYFGSIMIENSGANQALDQIDQRAQGTSNTFGALIGFAARAGAAIATGLGAALTAGIMANSNMEQYRATLETVMGDTKKAGETLDWVKQYAAKTPFEIPELVESTVKLQAMGLEAQKMLPIAADMAAVFSSSGKTVGDATEAINDAMMGEFERLKEFGIKLGATDFKEGGKYAGKSYAEAINAEVANHNYTGAVEKLGQTFSGRLSTLKDTVTQALSASTAPLFDKIADGMGKLIEKINELQANGTLQKWIDTATVGFNAFWSVGEVIFNGMVETGKFIVDNWGLIGPILAGVLAGFMAYATVQGVLQAVTLAQTALNLAMSLNPMGMVVIAIVALVAAGVALYQNWETVKAKAVEIWTAIQVSVGSVIGSVLAWFGSIPSAIGGFFTNALNIITTWGSSVATWVSTAVPSIINAILTFFNELPSKIGFALGYAIGTLIKWGADAVSWAITEVPKIISGIVTFFTELPGKIATEFTNVISKFGEWGSNVISWIATNVPIFIMRIINFYAELPGKVLNFLTQVITNMGIWINNMTTKVTAEIPILVTKIASFFGELPGKMLDIGKNIVESLWEGIKNAKDWLWGNLKDFAQGVIDGLKAGVGIESSSSTSRSSNKTKKAGNNAQGTDYWRGGLTWVGEEGPELINAPRGSQIFSNPESMAMAGGWIGGSPIIFESGAFSGAMIMDDYGVDRLMDRVMDRLALKGVR